MVGATSYRNTLSVGMLLAGLGLLVWSLWSLVTTHFPEWVGRGGSPTVATAVEGRAQVEVQYKLNQITSAHLFGITGKAAPTTAAAPETKLRLTLVGVLASPQPRYARALIQVASNDMKVYSLGDAINGTDASLYEIERDRVILDRKGAFESLAMTRNAAPIGQSVDEPAPVDQSVEEPAPIGQSVDEPASETRDPVMKKLLERMATASDVWMPQPTSEPVFHGRSLGRPGPLSGLV